MTIANRRQMLAFLVLSLAAISAASSHGDIQRSSQLRRRFLMKVNSEAIQNRALDDEDLEEADVGELLAEKEMDEEELKEVQDLEADLFEKELDGETLSPAEADELENLIEEEDELLENKDIVEQELEHLEEGEEQEEDESDGEGMGNEGAEEDSPTKIAKEEVFEEEEKEIEEQEDPAESTHQEENTFEEQENETEEEEKKEYHPTDIDPIVEQDEEIVEQVEQELLKQEKVARTAGGFGFVIAICAMVFTAHQMSENPDGIFASVCRLAITLASVVVKIICMPCRKVIGTGNPHYTGHMPISTNDYSYRGTDAGFEMS